MVNVFADDVGTTHPLVRQASPMVCELDEGDALFLPRGWRGMGRRVGHNHGQSAPACSTAHAATRRSKGLPACSGLPFGQERSALAGVGADERLRRRSDACPKVTNLAAFGSSRWHHAVISASPTERNLAVNLWYDLQVKSDSRVSSFEPMFQQEGCSTSSARSRMDDSKVAAPASPDM
jgi:hypothetical protein